MARGEARRDESTGTVDVLKKLIAVLASWAVAVAVGFGVFAGAGCGERADGATAHGGAFRVVRVFGELGKNPGQFNYPRCLDVADGSAWVIDKSARVQRLDAATGTGRSEWKMPESSLGKPCGITIGPGPAVGGSADKAVWIADTHCNRVVVYAMPGGLGEVPRQIASVGKYGTGPGEFIYPTDVAIMPTQDGKRAARVYVSEYGDNDRVSVFDGELRYLFSFGAFGSGGGADGTVEFNRPQAMAIDVKRGRLVVTDACNHRVGVFDLEGQLKWWIGSPEAAGAGASEMLYPYGVALLPDGTALVAEFGNHRINHVDLDGKRSVGTIGKPGRGPGELTNPWGMAVSGNEVYVLDSGNERVQVMAMPMPIRPAARARAEGRGG
ncbi:MAG: hypothetical protein ACKVW3_17785 [Phycisphaerales bacterium]